MSQNSIAVWPTSPIGSFFETGRDKTTATTNTLRAHRLTPKGKQTCFDLSKDQATVLSQKK